jgi:hypothetical protein
MSDFSFPEIEMLCTRFTRVDSSRLDLPPSFVLLNVYVASPPRTVDFTAFSFALEAFTLALDVPLVVVGDFNAHLRVVRGGIPSVRDREFQDFMSHMDRRGFAFYPGSPEELARPTFISDQGCTVIDYLLVTGVPSSGFIQSHITAKGHRGLEVSLDWPVAPSSVLKDRQSFRKHFRDSPPDDFFAVLSGGYGLVDAFAMLSFGISRVFGLLVLTLGQLFQVSRPPREAQIREPWQRYLSGAEIRALDDLDKEVFSLVAKAALGVPPLGLREAEQRYKELRKTLRATATRRMFVNIRDAHNDPGQLWSFVRKFRVSAERDVLPIDILVHHFSSVFNRVSDPVPIVFCDNFEVLCEELDPPFTVSELETAFKSLVRGTAPGVTGIGNDVLIELFRLPGGPEFFLSLFNACFLSGTIPTAWRCTEIFLLYKGKGSITDPNSYRGIALMESILKVFEKLLYGRLSRWAFSRGLVPDCQFGFRARAGTLDAVFVLYTLLVKYVFVKSCRLFVALIDFQKAFPSVNRALLLDKLGTMGVSPRFRRSLCSIFESNTFSLRSGEKVTKEFPMSTGLREGSVLSPLLFILFISDACDTVLRPFGRTDYLQRDPCLNSIPVPGLFYADDLVLICLTADGLRERLRRLKRFAEDNCLVVNVSNCEVVVFGRGPVSFKFKFNKEYVPVRASCKYLGVWLDQTLNGRALSESIRHKFKAGVPVLFSLCRRLQLSRLDLVYRLANSLLFSLLYGVEFLLNLNVMRECERAWWAGVRSFYGLPNGVSGAFLQLLFPRFSLTARASEAKFRLLLRGTRTVDTLLPEAILCDRVVLFREHRRGFTQGLKEWAEQLGLSSILFDCDLAKVKEAHQAMRDIALDEAWSRFSEMPSTSYAASIFESRSAVFQVLHEASTFSRLGVRAAMLAMSGSLAMSYTGLKVCTSCGVRFDFVHFLSCPALGSPLSPTLTSCVENKDWAEAANLILFRFQVFLHYVKGGNLSADETELFDALVRSTSGD